LSGLNHRVFCQRRFASTTLVVAARLGFHGFCPLSLACRGQIRGFSYLWSHRPFPLSCFILEYFFFLSGFYIICITFLHNLFRSVKVTIASPEENFITGKHVARRKRHRNLDSDEAVSNISHILPTLTINQIANLWIAGPLLRFWKNPNLKLR
jgi:hypothetical protein